MSGERPTRPLPPLKRWGQHFLEDRAVLARIVAALDLREDEALVEIGPGRGALTAPLLEAAGRLVAVEIDRGLAARLRDRFADGRLVVVEEDVLRFDLSRVAPLLEVPDGTPVVVAGNLPYNVSKPVAMRLVGERLRVARAVLMFQREVANRLVASPGSKDYAPLTVLAGLAYAIERLFDVPPGAFRPRPEVDSTVTRWRTRGEEVLPRALEPALRAALSAAFARRRGTLRSNLRAARGSEEAERLLAEAGLDPGARAETVPPEGFLRLARVWGASALGGDARVS